MTALLQSDTLNDVAGQSGAQKYTCNRYRCSLRRHWQTSKRRIRAKRKRKQNRIQSYVLVGDFDVSWFALVYEYKFLCLYLTTFGCISLSWFWWIFVSLAGFSLFLGVLAIDRLGLQLVGVTPDSYKYHLELTCASCLLATLFATLSS